MRRPLVTLATVVLAAVAPSAAFVAPAAAAGSLTVRGSDRSGGYIRSHPVGNTDDENVSAIFKVPTASCSSLPTTGGAVTIGAGVDGTVRSSKVRLQAGVRISCASRTSTPKYQIYWAQAPQVPQILGTTKPGHEIYVFVSSEDFQPVNVSDNTTGVLYAGSTGKYVTDFSSVECLVSAGITGSGALLPLPAFGTVTFTSCIDFSGQGESRQLADPSSARTGEATYQVQDDVGHVRTRTSPRKANGSWGVTWVAAS